MPDQQIVIGICGLKGSGKSVASRYFEAQGYRRMPFAAPIKVMLSALLQERGLFFDEIHRCLDGDLKEQPHPALSGRSPRHAMQTLGTEWARELMHRDFWVNSWRDMIRIEARVVADDLRFPNEAVAVEALGGRILRVERPGLIADTHVSERLLDGIIADEALLNDGTPEDFERLLAERFPPAPCPTP